MGNMAPPKRGDEDRCSRWVTVPVSYRTSAVLLIVESGTIVATHFAMPFLPHTIYSVCPVCHLFYLLCMPFIPLFHTDSDCPMVSSNSSSYVIYFK
jgi:hypothetical protein